MVADARRAASIIARVRAMAERREPERIALSLNALVEDVRVFLAHELRAQEVGIELNLQPDLAMVSGDRTQLQQVIVNLAVNAVQAMAEAGVADRRLRFTTSAVPAGGVALTVEDTGPGLPPEPARLFDSFYTTKASGMGMGLPICRTIVEAHGGDITGENAPDGARFTVTLPAQA
jgi:signal transduction histidine kinase